MREKFTVQAVGRLRSPYADITTTTAQSFCSAGRGTVEVFPEFSAGLDQIETFSHLMLFVVFDKAALEMLAEKPMWWTTEIPTESLRPAICRARTKSGFRWSGFLREKITCCSLRGWI